MKRRTKIAVTVAALATLAVGGVVYAQVPGRGFGPMGGMGMMGPGGGPARMCERGPAMLSGWLAYTETRLGITPEQRTAWTAFATDARAAADTLLKACPEMTQAPPDRGDVAAHLARAERMMQIGLDAMKIARPAIDRLNAVLTPEQRTRFAEMIPGGPRGPRGGGRFDMRHDGRSDMRHDDHRGPAGGPPPGRGPGGPGPRPSDQPRGG